MPDLETLAGENSGVNMEGIDVPTVNDVRLLLVMGGWMSQTNEELAALFSINSGIKGYPDGPWPTKSKGLLWRLFQIPYAEIQDVLRIPEMVSVSDLPVTDGFMEYNEAELHSLPPHVREYLPGFRIYVVRDIPEKGTGAGEFHRIRNEMLFCGGGVMDLDCEDLAGNKRTYTLKPADGLYIPHHIMHTYKMRNTGDLFVFANTQFDPYDDKTHDSFSMDIFREMQRG